MTTLPLLEGLVFAECPRWHDGKLWFSDIFAHRVMTVDERGKSEVVVQLGDEDLPAGLGFLPDGSLIMANLARPVLMRADGQGGATVYADLADLAVGPLNDMVVDDEGRAYVGASGTDPHEAPRPLRGTGSIIRVDPDGSSRIVADEMDAPNGMVITPDGKAFIVGSVPTKELLGFDRAADGSLHNRRVWADLRPFTTDGIAIDSESGVWTCSPIEQECRRVLEGGEVTDVVSIEGDTKWPLVPCLGGEDGRTLFICSIQGGMEAITNHTTKSVIETVRVDVAGW